MIWHSTEASDVLKELEVDENKGLHKGVAQLRQEKYGKNIITEKKEIKFLNFFLSQLKSKTVISLFVIAALAFAVALFYEDTSFYTPLLIVGIIVINGLVSAYHLWNSEKALNDLKKFSSPGAKVLRDGIIQNIPSEDLVPGDIILLETGDYVSADARVIDSNEFRINEINLSGEEIPVEKDGNQIYDDITPLLDRKNMIYAGTSVVHGTAKAVVVATGLSTEIGHTTAIMLQKGEETKLPIQNKLENISNIVNTVVLIGCALIFVIGLAQNFHVKPFANTTLKMLVNAAALAVAAIPESLPAIATTVIAIGISRIMHNNIIVKDIKALQTLGETTVICCDKTGTLTRNKMNLSCIFDGSRMIDIENEAIDEPSALLLKLATACSTLKNDSTEYAIEQACLAYTSFSKVDVDAHYPRFSEIPFDSERKTMTTINMIDSVPVAIVKGAPEVVLPKCVNCDPDKLLKINEAMANEALRIVCIAVKPLESVPANPHPDDVENELKFVGLLGFTDPPREDAYENIASCKNAGIKTVMITGDNLATAKSIAEKIGILEENDLAITGEELDAMSDEELQANIEKYSVFARVSPHHKLRIVRAWQNIKAIVTVTGDNMDDADSLTAADTGCAMSKFGTDVAKGNADVIIFNNRFDSLVCAIRESRGLIDNIKKALHYLLSCNLAEIITVLLGMIFFGGMPLTAVQILWINLLTDCAPALAISMENADDFVMDKKNHTLISRLFDSKATLNLVSMTAVMTVSTLIAFAIGGIYGRGVAATMAFLTLGLIQIFNSFNYKSNKSIFNKKVFSNRFMNLSSMLSVFIVIFLSFTPAGFVFGLTILSFGQFLISLALAALVIPASELVKFISKKYL